MANCGRLEAVISKGVLWMVLISLVLVGTGWTAEEKAVIAEGEAVGSSLQARDKALSRALRNAVEIGVGVFITSESKVKNYQLLEDKIYSRVEGYVKKYQVLEDNKGEGGIYRIKIKAEVSTDKLEKDLSDLGLLMARKGRPRTMILISEDIEGRGPHYYYSGEGLTAQTQMEKVFLEKGFPLVSKEQMEKIKERDVALSFDDPARAAALGERYGAELVIVGKAVSDSVRTSAPYGLKTYSYAAEIQARAVKVDTASIIVSDSGSAQQTDQGRFVAARKALKKASEKLALALIEQITKRWRQDVYNVVTIQLVVEKINFAQLTDLTEALKALEGVENVFRRSFARGTAAIEVEIRGTAEQLATDLSRLSKIKLEIVGTTPNRIDLRVIE